MASPFIPLQRDRLGSQAGPPAQNSGFRPLNAQAPPPAAGAPAKAGGFGDPMAFAAALGITAKPEVPPPASSAGAAHGHGHQQMTPVVTARKEGDRITHLIVRCPCGAVTEIECLY